MNRTEDFRRHKTEVHQKRQIKLAKVNEPDRKLTDREKGRYRRHSFCDCGIPHCPMCMNPRHNKLFKTKEQLTVKEQVWIDKLKQELIDLSIDEPLIDWNDLYKDKHYEIERIP